MEVDQKLRYLASHGVWQVIFDTANGDVLQVCAADANKNAENPGRHK